MVERRRIGIVAIAFASAVAVAAAWRIDSESVVAGTKATENRSGKSIGVLDVKYVLRNNTNLQKELNQLKEFVSIEERAAAHRLKDSEWLASWPSRTRHDYLAPVKEDAEEEYVALANPPEPTLSPKFLRMQTEIYERAYTSMRAEVESYCKENRIDMVIRISNAATDPREPDEVLRRADQPVFWKSAAIRDISQEIVSRMNKRTAGTRASNP